MNIKRTMLSCALCMTIPTIAITLHAKKNNKKNIPTQTQKGVTVSLSNIEEMVTKTAYNMLAQEHIDIKLMPQSFLKILEKKIYITAQQIIHEYTELNKTIVQLSVIKEQLSINIKDIIAQYGNAVAKKDIPKVTQAFIDSMFQEKKINKEKIPTIMLKELSEKTTKTINALLAQCTQRHEDFIAQQEIEKECHNVFDLFLERAHYIILAAWGQLPMQTLQALRHTQKSQPFDNKNA